MKIIKIIKNTLKCSIITTLTTAFIVAVLEKIVGIVYFLICIILQIN